MDATPVSGRRFGLTADTHDALVDWPKVMAGLTAAWGEVDGILHCGDVTTFGALDDLGKLAPVYATRSSGDPPAAAPTLTDGPRVLAMDGARIGLTFNLPEAERSAGQDFLQLAERDGGAPERDRPDDRGEQRGHHDVHGR